MVKEGIMKLHWAIPIKKKTKIYISIIAVTFLVLKAPDIYWHYKAEKEIEKFGGELIDWDVHNSKATTEFKIFFDQGKVKSVFFSNQKLKDHMGLLNLPFLKHINDLKVVYIYGNSFTFVNFNQFNISNLKSLELYNVKEVENGSTFKITNKNLKILTIADSKLENLIFNGDLNIEYLHLRNSKIKKLVGIENLSKLKELNLAYVGVTDISPLEKCLDLKVLDIHGFNVFETSPLKKLKKLKELSISTNGDLSFLKELTSLEELNIWYHSPTINIQNAYEEYEKVERLEKELKEIKKALPNCKVYSNFDEDMWGHLFK